MDNIQEFVKRRDAVLLADDDIYAEAAFALIREASGYEPDDDEKKLCIALAACHKARLGLANVTKRQKMASIAWLGLNGFHLPEWMEGE
ncbi:MAG: hypothetical protein IJ521_07680 [Schwartzia sp.]|nr:hypothetical protein [Schwartzia sp. (in: firmicutes)]